jgi:hypothetical protein
VASPRERPADRRRGLPVGPIHPKAAGRPIARCRLGPVPPTEAPGDRPVSMGARPARAATPGDRRPCPVAGLIVAPTDVPPTAGTSARPARPARIRADVHLDRSRRPADHRANALRTAMAPAGITQDRHLVAVARRRSAEAPRPTAAAPRRTAAIPRATEAGRRTGRRGVPIGPVDHPRRADGSALVPDRHPGLVPPTRCPPRTCSAPARNWSPVADRSRRSSRRVARRFAFWSCRNAGTRSSSSSFTPLGYGSRSSRSRVGR